ncbi:MAG: hypothetical protein L0191_03175 [Acidobacteria bacterium]|nr:hypothetical protein [Acidobacteriota bacterium]
MRPKGTRTKGPYRHLRAWTLTCRRCPWARTFESLLEMEQARTTHEQASGHSMLVVEFVRKREYW